MRRGGRRGDRRRRIRNVTLSLLRETIVIRPMIFGLLCHVLVVAALATTVSAQTTNEIERHTTFATIHIRPPQISGEVWLPTDTFPGISDIDRDGDFTYSQNELNSARFLIERFLADSLFVLWSGQFQPIQASVIEIAARPTSHRTYFKVSFRVRDYAPGQDIAIVSRMFRHLAPTARCVADITRDARRELFVFGPTSYYDTARTAPKIPRDSHHRPPEQRGRIAAFRNIALEMLYAMPEGVFTLYYLEGDRYTPHGIDAKSVTASIGPKVGGTAKKVTLTAKPLPTDEKGKCSRFVAAAADMKAHDLFNADINVTVGAESGRLIFDFPAVNVMQPAADKGAATRRYACSKWCIGVQTTKQSSKCPRCGSALLPVRGDGIPGYGVVGPHGGELREMRPRMWIEAVLVSRDELRLYMTNPELEARPVGKMTGTILLSTDEHFEETSIEVPLEPAKDGKYFRAAVPDSVKLPIRARCSLQSPGDEGQLQAEFFLQGLNPVD